MNDIPLYLPSDLRSISTTSQLIPSITEAIRVAFPDLTKLNAKSTFIRFLCVQVEERVRVSNVRMTESGEKGDIVRAVYQGLFPSSSEAELNLVKEFSMFCYDEGLIHVRSRFNRIVTAIVSYFR